MSTNERKSNFFSSFAKNKIPRLIPLTGAGSVVGLSAASAEVSNAKNSAGASRNLEKVSKDLDNYFHSIEGRDASLNNVLPRSRWVEKVEACSNSAFTRCSLVETRLEPIQHSLAELAALSALKVYGKPEAENISSGDFDVVGQPLRIEPFSWGSSIKTTAAWLYSPRKDCAISRDVIVVAIRGTVTMYDWVVNLNDRAETLVEEAFLGTDGEGSHYRAHAGFLGCAKAMNTMVADLIYQLWSTNFATGVRSKPMLLFTGHSAGGAVAALIYTHFLKCDASVEEVKRFQLKSALHSVHCVTFGAPPVTTKSLSPFHVDSVFLSIVNDGDPVPRADGEYIPALLRLFSRSLPEEEIAYALPPRVLFNAGLVIIALPSCQLVMPNESGAGSLAETVMGDQRQHQMKEYLRRIAGN